MLPSKSAGGADSACDEFFVDDSRDNLSLLSDMQSGRRIALDLASQELISSQRAALVEILEQGVIDVCICNEVCTESAPKPDCQLATSSCRESSRLCHPTGTFPLEHAPTLRYGHEVSTSLKNCVGMPGGQTAMFPLALLHL